LPNRYSQRPFVVERKRRAPRPKVHGPAASVNVEATVDATDKTNRQLQVKGVKPKDSP
jgi:hypothetical protein